MSSDLRSLYQDVILDHDRHPRNFRAMDNGRKADGINPLCGDRLTVYVRVDSGTMADVSFQGNGCAIAIASASLMTEGVKGRTVAEAEAMFARVQQLVIAPADAPVENLGELSALAGVRLFPVRAKCALLAWHAMRTAATAGDPVVTTE